VNFVLTVVREFLRHDMTVGAVPPDVLSRLHPISDDLDLLSPTLTTVRLGDETVDSAPNRLLSMASHTGRAGMVPDPARQGRLTSGST
jgi:hypothetical protein